MENLEPKTENAFILFSLILIVIVSVQLVIFKKKRWESPRALLYFTEEKNEKRINVIPSTNPVITSEYGILQLKA